MRLSGKISAAIAILDDFDQRRVPLKTAIADWSRGNRYAGAKDRAWISGLCLDVLRRRRTIEALMGASSTRALALGGLAGLWRMSVEDIALAAAEEPHGPGALSDEERTTLINLGDRVETGGQNTFDAPDWTTPLLERVFGDQSTDEILALGARADIDLRINSLKATPEKAMAALKSVNAVGAPPLTTAARIAAPPPSERAPAVMIIPAFSKGWVEVQDLGSQIAAAAAGDIKGKQVLDYCAGGGGKTLALAAQMANSGQLHAYDSELRRLAPLFDRAKRAGLRNVQICSPLANSTTPEDAIATLKEKMDVVFIDAPCTGSGTWRRHPDTKWRLTEQQLERRCEEQNAVLAGAANYVKPAGRMVYVTCSVFMEENEDRLAQFLRNNSAFEPVSTVAAIKASGLLLPGADESLQRWQTPEGYLRLTPHRTGTDGFFIAVLQRA